jgi:Zn-dependent peptidase ImmA (M78 family)
MTGWRVWRELRRRPHLELRFGELAHSDGALIDVDGRRRIVVLDHRLGRRDRNAVLAHELVHDERGLLFDDATPIGIVRKEEAIVDAITAARLVPLDELEAFLSRCDDADGITANDVADEFDVPADIAARAIRLLEQRAIGSNHPSLRRFV